MMNNANHPDLLQALDYLVEQAMRDAAVFGDYEPLTNMLMDTTTCGSVIQNDSALRIICSRLLRKKSKKPKSKTSHAKNIRLGLAAWAFHGAGLPKWNDPFLSKSVSAATTVGKIYNASESAVRKAILLVESEGNGTHIGWLLMGKDLGFEETKKRLASGKELADIMGEYLSQKLLG